MAYNYVIWTTLSGGIEECEMVRLRSNFVTSFARSGNLKSLRIL